ncbi:MAG: primosome assembly protein PriA [Propionibacteriales bacterium]|nr:primosome assembly protein PriA [Propionibacteriales bacterium]
MTAGPESAPDAPEQLALVRERARRARPKPTPAPAADRPVARVLVDVSLAHLDRPFDYLVREDIAEDAQPGCRVRVRFAGKQVGGYILERLDESAHQGDLAPITRLVSAEPVLRPEIARLARLVADRYAGVAADVVRLAVPPRHARVERESAGTSSSPSARSPNEGGADEAVSAQSARSAWSPYPAGPAFLDRLREGDHPRGVWNALPETDWPVPLAQAAAATLAGGRGAVLCMPDNRDVQRVVETLRTVLGSHADTVAVVTADAGPAPRYREFLRVLRGEARIVVGARSAAFAPVRDLGLVAIWDDGDDLHAEQRAPYPHSREVLALRAYSEEVGMLIGGFARTAEAQLSVESGWAQPLVADRSRVRAAAPRVQVTGGDERDLARDSAAQAARLPHRAFETAREALRTGPVLVQVPRAGYLPALSCVRCRRPARCAHCQGPLRLLEGGRVASCVWCGRPAAGWRCSECGADRFRAPVVGSQRTAEELGRAFPDIPVVTSSVGRVRGTVPGVPALVVATPGAEPVADDGYAAALILDTWLTLARPALRTSEEAVRRWLNAAALVRSGEAGGRVVLVGDPAVAQVQSVVRWDPAGAAGRELADRTAAHLPPGARVAVVSGPDGEVTDLVRALELPAGGETLGPLSVDEDTTRAVLRVPRGQGAALSRLLKQAQATRSSRKLPHLRIQVDPQDVG